MSLVLRLAAIDKGKLFRISFEMALPPEIRRMWPGKESRASLARFLMDASGESLFLIDLETGRYIQMPFTAKEQRWFNAFDDGDDAVTINHRELLSEFFLVILLGPAHAGKLLEFCNDNTPAENWTSRSRHRHSRVDEILSVLGFIELLLKQTMFGSRVPTKKNFADTGTRLDLHKAFITQLADLEHKYGWKAQQVPIPNDVRNRLP